MTSVNRSQDDIQSKAHDDELNKAEDRIEDTLEEDRIERRQQRDVPSPRQIANVLRSENINK